MSLCSVIIICFMLGPDQIPLMEDLEQILMHSWRESHLTEKRQYQQSYVQFPAPFPGLAQPITPSQLPWLAKLATSSCGDAVLVLDTAPSVSEALADTFQRLMEGKLSHTHFVVIICMGRSQETESCIVVTGKRLHSSHVNWDYLAIWIEKSIYIYLLCLYSEVQIKVVRVLVCHIIPLV